MKKKIVLFASGNGSNVERICDYFSSNKMLEVYKVFTNNKNAKVLDRIIPYDIPGECFSREEFKGGVVTTLLKKINPDLIVLAGFLWKVPLSMVMTFPNLIINIHPSLLPKYGGKGMYGSHVHQAVKLNQEKETGITIHYVNENYDEGAVIFQKSVEIYETDSPFSIAQKVHQLEHTHFPVVIEQLLFKTLISG